MPDTFAITVIFIVVSTLIAAFVKRTKRDKCLKDFAGNTVTLNLTAARTTAGKLRVENTGLELTYPPDTDTNTKRSAEPRMEKTSYILYKHEFPNIQTLIRYHDHLSEQNKIQRNAQLEKTYHPNTLQKSKRKIQNIFKTVRDSIAEVVNLLMSRAKASTVGTTLTSQDKYVTQMKNELMGSVGTSYEPLLERHIGHKVILELINADKISEHIGVLKEYTANFIEIMDVDYKDNPDSDTPAKKTDLIVPRNLGLIRNLAE
ncbi:MAG: hypothetical protein FVQ80_03920 [Planctomycetes bacterium]|nr:hypothetical protein [Planctomycetota bacterium]